MKKRIGTLLVVLMLFAASALAEAPAVKKTEYEGNGIVEVDFSSKRVTYKKAKVVVKDDKGSSLKVRILEKDNDDLTFKVTGLKPSGRYTYTISGIRAGTSGKYGTVSGTFRAPSDRPVIRTVKYDRKDRELEIEFGTRVQFKNLKVTVTDGDGRPVAVKRIRKGTDELEARVPGLKKGDTYSVTVSGVRVKGVGRYIDVTKRFTVR